MYSVCTGNDDGRRMRHKYGHKAQKWPWGSKVAAGKKGAKVAARKKGAKVAARIVCGGRAANVAGPRRQQGREGSSAV